MREAEAATPDYVTLLVPDHLTLQTCRLQCGPEGQWDPALDALDKCEPFPKLTSFEATGGFGAASASLDRAIRAWLEHRNSDSRLLVHVDRLDAAKRVSRRLRAAGEATSIYGVDPDYFYAVVPLDRASARTAQRFVLNLKKTGSGLKARAKRWIQLGLIALGRPERLFESFVVRLDLESASADRSDAWWLGTSAAAESVALPMTSCRRSHGNDLILKLKNGATDPCEVFKAVRDPRFGMKIENEAVALRSVATLASLQEYAPRFIAAGTTGGRPYLIQSGLQGISLAARLLRCPQSQFEALLRPALDWLAEWSVLTPSGDSTVAPVLPSEWNSISKLDDGLLDAHGVFAEPAVRTKLLRALERMRSSSRRFLLHGDFWQTNLLADPDGRVEGLFDWEFFHPESPVPSDCIWYLINACYFRRQRDGAAMSILEAFRSDFPTDARGDDFVGREFRRYCDATDLDPGTFGDAVLVTLLQLSQRELRAYGVSFGMDAIGRDLAVEFAGRLPDPTAGAHS